jgi:hypothetical protein
MSGTAKFRQLATLKNGVTWSSNPQFDAETGTAFYIQKCTVRLKGITTPGRNIVSDIGANGQILLVPRRDGTWWELGGGYVSSTTVTGGGLFLTSDSKMDSGSKPSDYAGIELVFEGEEYTNCREVASAVIATVV